MRAPLRTQQVAKRHRLRFGRVMRIARLLPLLVLLTGVSASARESLGMFETWGAFRDPETPRCYAIARPVRRGAAGYATIAAWPRQHVRAQVHFRLSRTRAPDRAVILNIDDRRFTLVAGKRDAWAADARGDAAIIAAIRSGTAMSVQTSSANGGAFADTYALRGAATAIDAAALGCARLR